ncbi:ATP-dependent helicase [Sulfurimonas sp. C5]|uniref:ATP-dependent helicase n=1 Tax=Sulfurimonas sp. C5 TaxID=3036947 RepID=UPI002458ECB0|nr:ATP-dependent helicase [Sulfurimonas sp. C5]MDH4943964.1 ATP-dependent helicase [Sulfurimonas sp. C5]
MDSIKLSERQKKIVEYDDKPIYVKASAGSGKTRVLTERIRFQLSKTKKKILALTFTNKAGEEIKERLEEQKVDIKNRLFVGTFHSFCQYVLENHGSSIGVSQMPHIFESDKDRIELISQAIEQVPTYYESYKNKSLKDKNDFRYRALNFISKVKRELITDSEFHNHTEDSNIILLYQTYQEILRSQNAIDFDDLLLLTYQLFIEFPHISALYRRSFYSICVDEAQDLNNAQYNLLLALCGGDFKNIMMVGDPKQSIYHFNGSSSDYMNKEFPKDFNADVFELNENYRSSKKVIEAASKIISIENKDIIAKTVYDGEFKIQSCDDEFREAQCIIDKIKELINKKEDKNIEGLITLEKIVVLARNKYVFNNLEKLLNKESIPYHYKMSGGSIKFESALMSIFDLKLKIKLNPLDILHKKQLEDSSKKNTFLLGDIDTLVENLKDDGSNLKSSLSNFRNTLNDMAFDNDNDKTMVMNDIDELLNHWSKYAKNTDKKSLLQFKNSMALGKTSTVNEDKGITLSTVHTMKGQEFDIVFIIGMDDGTFPDYRAIQNGGIEMEQEKNNLYVAFTRAKRFLYVTYPLQRTMPWGAVKHKTPSRFLKF